MGVDVAGAAALSFHRQRGRLATIAVVRPPARYGAIDIDDHLVVNFGKQPRLNQGWISGGIFVCEPGVLDYIDGDRDHLEIEPVTRLSRDYQLAAYRHRGFWRCLDTMRDKRLLDALWESGEAPWRLWDPSARRPAAPGSQDQDMMPWFPDPRA